MHYFSKMRAESAVRNAISAAACRDTAIHMFSRRISHCFSFSFLALCDTRRRRAKPADAVAFANAVAPYNIRRWAAGHDSIFYFGRRACYAQLAPMRVRDANSG